MKVQITSDGTMIEFLADGSKKQTRATGECILTQSDGTIVQTKEGSTVTITRAPGGYLMQEDSATGIKIHRYALLCFY